MNFIDSKRGFDFSYKNAQMVCKGLVAFFICGYCFFTVVHMAYLNLIVLC